LVGITHNGTPHKLRFCGTLWKKPREHQAGNGCLKEHNVIRNCIDGQLNSETPQKIGSILKRLLNQCIGNSIIRMTLD
jgi:hypothetical protein